MLTKLLASKLTQQWPKQWPDPFFSTDQLPYIYPTLRWWYQNHSPTNQQPLLGLFSAVADFSYSPPSTSLLYIQLNLPLWPIPLCWRRPVLFFLPTLVLGWGCVWLRKDKMKIVNLKNTKPPWKILI